MTTAITEAFKKWTEAHKNALTLIWNLFSNLIYESLLYWILMVSGVILVLENIGPDGTFKDVKQIGNAFAQASVIIAGLKILVQEIVFRLDRATEDNPTAER